MMIETTIEAVYVGKVRERWPGKAPSAIDKTPVHERVSIAKQGLISDAQADLKVHGGPDKALHHYPGDHYPDWQREFDRSDLVPGRFGENLSTFTVTEDTVSIGDIFRLGSALVQISQGRQPCWKLNAHTSEDSMAYRFQKTGRTGWYYRVLETGEVGPGDSFVCVERPTLEWSVKRVTAARLSRRIDRESAEMLAGLETLAEGWRSAFARMATGDRQEDTEKRLIG